MRPLDSWRFFLESVTGAATTRFCVKTAAAEAGTSLEISARSSAPVFFRPQAVAAKRNPFGSADSGGGWVISQALLSTNGFPGQRWPRALNFLRYHRERFWRPARLRLSDRRKNRYRTRQKFCEAHPRAIRSIVFAGVPLLSEFCRRHHALGGTAHLCERDSRQLRWRAVRGSKRRRASGRRDTRSFQSRRLPRRACPPLDRARRRELPCLPASRVDSWWAALSK